MSFEQFQQQQPEATVYGPAVDVGLQGYMRAVFNTMALGLALTGLSAWAVASVPALTHLVFGTPLKWVAIFGPLAFLWLGFTPARVMRTEPSKLRGMFYVFAAVMGVSMASIFLMFSPESIARAFFITAGAFAGLSIYGYTTKRDLTKIGAFLFMGLIGVCLASVVNIFMHSSALQFFVSVAGVVVFTGLTAFDVQRIKETYHYAGGGSAAERFAVMGALSLYLDFVNLFQIILQFVGMRRN